MRRSTRVTDTAMPMSSEYTTQTGDVDATTTTVPAEKPQLKYADGAGPRYKRVLLKLSGEALAGDQGSGIDPAMVITIADQVRDVVSHDVEVAIVVGGGNIW